MKTFILTTISAAIIAAVFIVPQEAANAFIYALEIAPKISNGLIEIGGHLHGLG